MKPAPFEYAAPADLDEALALLAAEAGDVRPLAGGQSLVPAMSFRLAFPDRLVDLNRIEELRRIEERPDGGLLIGAMVRQRRLERDSLVAARAPLIAEAVPWIAHAQIRTRGTIGGSIAHADPAAELPAVLLVLGAVLETARAPRDGEGQTPVCRRIPVEEFFLGPFFTSLEPGELVTAIAVPGLAGREGTAFAEVARRRGDYAIVGAAARVRLGEDGTCVDAALALVNGGPAPTLLPGAAAALVDGPVTAERIEEAASIAAAECARMDDAHGGEAYRRHLAGVLARRTLARAAERARAADDATLAETSGAGELDGTGEAKRAGGSDGTDAGAP